MSCEHFKKDATLCRWKFRTLHELGKCSNALEESREGNVKGVEPILPFAEFAGAALTHVPLADKIRILPFYGL